MTRPHLVALLFAGLAVGSSLSAVVSTQSPSGVGREVAVARHLQDGEEHALPLSELLAHGKLLFAARWTTQEGAGRPQSKGTGAPIVDPGNALEFPRAFNRVSGPDANACAGCHNAPFGIVGGGGDIVANVFVLAQRFDFATFENDGFPTRGAVDERGRQVSLQSIGNSRITVGMFGSGYIEMLSRQMTGDLRTLRDGLAPGQQVHLHTKGVDFGVLRRRMDGTWDTSSVQGLAAPSLVTTGSSAPPSLIIRPFHQAGQVVSLRQFTNNAFNHHHGIQSAERFGANVDADGDGFVNELTRGDVTAATLFQAAMAVPGRVIPDDPDVEAAVQLGERRFTRIGCATCHRTSLPLDRQGWIFTEPNPFNPPGNLSPRDGPVVALDLSRRDLPGPRLQPVRGVVHVPAFTDLKLHDLSDGPDDPNIEPLDMNQPTGSEQFFAGNRLFLTRKLWGTGNDGTYFHHGQYTTIRAAIQAHGGEASGVRLAFRALPPEEQDAVVEFLKSLQVLPPGIKSPAVNEHGRPKPWPSQGPGR